MTFLYFLSESSIPYFPPLRQTEETADSGPSFVLNGKNRARSSMPRARFSGVASFPAVDGNSAGLLHAVLVGLDHLLDHLAAHGTSLTGGQVAVVALLQVDADLGSGLHLELVESLASAGDNSLIGTVSTAG